jgi:hypothetical protein
VRGLKLNYIDSTGYAWPVAPFTGAWIETAETSQAPAVSLVAPFTGAWIETNTWNRGYESSGVAPSRVRELKKLSDR